MNPCTQTLTTSDLELWLFLTEVDLRSVYLDSLTSSFVTRGLTNDFKGPSTEASFTW